MGLHARWVTIRIALVACVAGLAIAAVALLSSPSPAAASGNQVAIFQDDPQMLTSPALTARTLQILRSLGVGVIRVTVLWQSIAPNPTSTTRPAFDATDPGAYPAANWGIYDEVVKDAQQDGIQVDFVLTGAVRIGGPAWAGGPGAPSSLSQFGAQPGLWKPSATEYGEWVHALGTRYSGSYTPQGASAPLPRVSFWELWNEPNWGLQLTPQTQSGGLGQVAPVVYRQLVNSGFSALQNTGHGQDTILIGNLAPMGNNNPGLIGFTRPLNFVQTLYCVNSSYKRLQGSAASAAGCPSSSAQFSAQNPALFSRAVQFGIHLYPYGSGTASDPENVGIMSVSRLITALAKVQGVYGSGKKFALYNNEYGLITSPPAGHPYPSTTTAAREINQAEYTTYRNSRVAATSQYLLQDTPAKVSGFFTGLLFSNGRPKATFYAYRMPIWLPVTQTRRGGTLEVWGCVRPATFARRDTGQPQTAWIQYRPGSGQFRTIQAVRINNGRGYIDVRVRFPGSGQVRLAWRYPSGDNSLRDPIDSSQWIYSTVWNIKLT
jgi:hypothetical protein